jgi:metal-responsive CopG/Arc/MetJ family transcriptional regulator
MDYMSTVSIRLSDSLLKEVEERAKSLRIPRAEYIPRAIEAMNREVLAQKRRNRLQQASHRVQQESMRANAELSAMEPDPRSIGAAMGQSAK